MATRDKQQLGSGPVEGNNIPGDLEIGGDLVVKGSITSQNVNAPAVTGEWPAGSPGVDLCAALDALGLIDNQTTEAEE